MKVKTSTVKISETVRPKIKDLSKGIKAHDISDRALERLLLDLGGAI